MDTVPSKPQPSSNRPRTVARQRRRERRRPAARQRRSERAAIARWRNAAPLHAVWALAVILGACDSSTGPDVEPIEQLPRSLSVAEAEVVRAGNDFSFRLLRAVDAEEAKPNILLSPLSASMALGMALNGANGATFDAMRETLGFDGLELGEIDEAYHDLIDLLLTLDPSLTLGIANSVWYRDTFHFEEAFLTDVEHYFDARIEALDFADPGARDVINGWVDEETRGRIPEIIDEIRPDHVMFLINAVYFKAPWVHRFDPADTRPAPFHRPGGSETPVPMMHRTGPLRWFSDEAVTVADLPYGGGAYSMVIVLPARGRTLDDVITELDAERWRAWMERLPPEPAEAALALPRFRMTYDIEMNDVLTTLGMGIAFTGAADFTRMHADGGLLITEVKQKTFIEVNEEGTEAAAATSVGIGLTSGPAGVFVDRPFLLAIRERYSGTILFIGKVTDPPAA